MQFIGEYGKESTILFELLTKDELGMPIHTDLPPIAIVEYFDANGLSEVVRVTLESIGVGRYIKPQFVRQDWSYGDYFVIYEAVLDGVTYRSKERFQVSEIKDLLLSIAHPEGRLITISDETIQSATGTPTTIVIAGSPVAGAIVEIVNPGGFIEATATTTSKGSWMSQVKPGTYTFNFYHPDGTLLRTMEKAVK